MTVPVAVAPEVSDALRAAIEAGGGELAGLADARALVWASKADGFPERLPAGIEWVQLHAAGIEDFVAAGVLERYPDVRFTSAAGAFSATVAEHALALLLAGVRYLPEHLRATTWRQRDFLPHVGTLRGSTVAVVGAGGIGRALIPSLLALGAEVIAVNRSGRPVTGPGIPEGITTVPADRLDTVWPVADHVVVAAPATPATAHLVGSAELALLRPNSWVINVARGSLIDTEALLAALRAGTIGGAGLDVTDPEPLPDGHPLWTLPNVIITPHDSNPPQVRVAAFAAHVRENVRRFAAGDELLAPVDPGAGY
ncbi:D-isomer specific 2-hydroxyacid dehydrogenase family protein [Nocardia harenae]|uniref:D-isomer specific 2-hydroxyacid dehydrogenase family protein n=1 Tax=Nocardia harenae TaxID=358707 RepID=UPI000831ACF8